MEYGLIGEHLSHSFSKEIHERLGTYKYELKELNLEEFKFFMENRTFKAINVTIPYKEKVIPYLDYIDQTALSIGAINTIINKDGKLYGYNTDYLGLNALFKYMGLEIQNKKVLILGSGGTSKTSYAVCQTNKAKSIIKASLNAKAENEIPYEKIKDICNDTDIIINTTPCGMYPNNDQELINLDDFAMLEGVVDVIYNPLRTKLVEKALERKLKASGGLYMLVAQAVYASALFHDITFDDSIINDIYRGILETKENIVLIGMPSCGKTTLGKLVSQKINRELIDTDEEIKKIIGMEIGDYILKYGEPAFREIEKQIVKDVAKKSNIVIATGGGSILDNDNVKALKQNGKLFFINRSLKNLETTSSRPLSSNKELLTKCYENRLPIYTKIADVIIDGDLELEKKVKLIIGE